MRFGIGARERILCERPVARPLLIEVIDTMILISINPFDLRKVFLFVAGLICLSALPCFAGPLLLTVNSTPYDRQMSRIQPVLSSKGSTHKEDVSMTLVNHWIQNLREIPYGFSAEWKTPAEVQSAPAADCKGKAVALYEKMQAHGARNVRLVIGKRTFTSRKTHAWLEWNTEAGRYVLDPTINWTACRVEQVGNNNYLPLYAYAGTRKYRAENAALVASN
jgi:predicted transglutaminase-like cysteine proteinase